MSGRKVFNCLKFSLVAAFMLFLQVSFAQSRFAAFDKLVEERKKQFGPEFSLMLVDADSIRYQKIVGDLPPRTPLPLGTASQWLTTALIMQLADEGKLSLDDKVSQYLPIFESYRKGYITIRHCLSHQTGIGRDGFKLSALFEKDKFNTLEEAIPSIAKQEIHANAGEQFRYSNHGIVIVARIAEIVTKKRFEQLMRTKLFVPMGMRNTTFTTDDGSAPNPATGAKSTVADYSKFLQMLLNRGKIGDRQILSEAAVEEMRKVQIRKEQVTGLPKIAEGFSFTLGTWMAEGTGNLGDKATTLVLPGMNGSWAMADFSRRYALVLLPKNFSGEQVASPYTELKVVANQQFPPRSN